MMLEKISAITDWHIMNLTWRLRLIKIWRNKIVVSGIAIGFTAVLLTFAFPAQGLSQILLPWAGRLSMVENTEVASAAIGCPPEFISFSNGVKIGAIAVKGEKKPWLISSLLTSSTLGFKAHLLWIKRCFKKW
jgi:hypothetical protein